MQPLIPAIELEITTIYNDGSEFTTTRIVPKGTEKAAVEVMAKETSNINSVTAHFNKKFVAGYWKG